jgi:hypothetical protein
VWHDKDLSLSKNPEPLSIGLNFEALFNGNGDLSIYTVNEKFFSAT